MSDQHYLQIIKAEIGLEPSEQWKERKEQLLRANPVIVTWDHEAFRFEGKNGPIIVTKESVAGVGWSYEPPKLITTGPDYWLPDVIQDLIKDSYRI